MLHCRILRPRAFFCVCLPKIRRGMPAPVRAGHRRKNRISASLATVELKPEGKQTRLVFTEQGAFLDGLDQVVDREQGWREILGHLARELERDAAAA